MVIFTYKFNQHNKYYKYPDQKIGKCFVCQRLLDVPIWIRHRLNALIVPFLQNIDWWNR